MNLYEVIRRPLVTEKGVLKKDTERTLCFEVSAGANKTQVKSAVEKLFKLDALNAIYRRCARPGDEGHFLDRALDDLGVRYRLAADDLARVPRRVLEAVGHVSSLS